MKHILYHIYINMYMLPLLVCAPLSLKAWKRAWPVPYKWFSALLILVLLSEIFAISWKYYYAYASHTYLPYNIWFYNIAMIPEHLLYMAFYFQVIRSAVVKRWIIIAAIAYFVLAISNMFFQSIHDMHFGPTLLGYTIIVLLTIAYFDQVRKDKEIIKLSTHPLVWISLGALIFHASDIPYMLSLNYLNQDTPLAKALSSIHLILNSVMYTLYIIAFLCHPPPSKQ